MLTFIDTHLFLALDLKSAFVFKAVSKPSQTWGAIQSLEHDGLNPLHVSGSCNPPSPQQTDFVLDRKALSEKECVRASQSEDTRSLTHPQLAENQKEST